MDFAAIKQYVYDYMDLEVDDMSPALIERWAAEGYARLVRHSRKWPFYETTVAENTVAGTKAYSFPQLRTIYSVESPGVGQLRYLEHTEAKARFWRIGDPETGEPVAFSWWNEQLHLWPTPDAEYELSIEAYRNPSATWPAGDASVPDLPSPLHEVLLNWVMHRAYQHQDDPEMSELELQHYTDTLERLTAEEIQAPTAAPIVYGGTKLQRRGGWVPGTRLKFPWE